MRQKRYKLKRELLAVYSDGDVKGCVQLPAGTVVEVVGEEAPFVLLACERSRDSPPAGEQYALRAFEQDVVNRAEPLPALVALAAAS